MAKVAVAKKRLPASNVRICVSNCWPCGGLSMNLCSASASQAGIRSTTSDATIWSCVGWWHALSLTSNKSTFCSTAVRWSVLCCRISRRRSSSSIRKMPGGAIWPPTICSRHFTCVSLPNMRPTSRPKLLPIGSVCQATIWPICSPSISIGYASGPRASRPATLARGRWISSRGST
ncbi:hypothetical protein D3C76_1066640 [compost metagenome]